MRDIIIIAHNIRSSYNVGSVLRTADGLAVSKVYFTGYTPYPKVKNDQRLPHQSAKASAQIAKTALGAEQLIDIEHASDITKLVKLLKRNGYTVCALEQSSNATILEHYKPSKKVALVIGSEIGGLDLEVQDLADDIIEIPMLGKKESFNVAVAAAITLYYLRYCK